MISPAVIPRRRPARAHAAYVLLETVIATGLLILGLAVLGARVQDSGALVPAMNAGMRHRMLAEMFLGELETGSIIFDRLDEELEDEFGPRYPQYGWRMTVTETAVEELFHLTIEILHWPRETYEESFDFDEAEVVYTLYAMRLIPEPLDLGVSYGLKDEEVEELAEKLSGLGIEGLDPYSFNPAFLASMDIEELVQALPTLMDAFGMDVSQFMGQIPPEMLEALEAAGLEGLGGGENGGEREGEGGGR